MGGAQTKNAGQGDAANADVAREKAAVRAAAPCPGSSGGLRTDVCLQRNVPCPCVSSVELERCPPEPLLPALVCPLARCPGAEAIFCVLRDA